MGLVMYAMCYDFYDLVVAWRSRTGCVIHASRADTWHDMVSKASTVVLPKTIRSNNHEINLWYLKNSMFLNEKQYLEISPMHVYLRTATKQTPQSLTPY